MGSTGGYVQSVRNAVAMFLFQAQTLHIRRQFERPVKHSITQLAIDETELGVTTSDDERRAAAVWALFLCFGTNVAGAMGPRTIVF